MNDKQKDWLREALGLSQGETAFPWQEELLRRFLEGRMERALDIPTGLGKTAVMAIWLVARALGAALPRRLAYVVDRRAVVDQATQAAMNLREFVEGSQELKDSLDLNDRPLPLSTLRGQYVDNKEWLENPASTAIIVGTVDLIGSRLLFEGYRTSTKMRPYHAGLIGADTLVVLDEAHLVPPFEKLVEAIEDGAAIFGPRDNSLAALVPPLKLLALSATGRTKGKPFTLQAADLEHPIVRRRLDAVKRLTLLPPHEDTTTLSNALAKEAWVLAGNGSDSIRCIVYCDKRKDAEETFASITKLANGDKKKGIPKTEICSELFVGARRVHERDLATKWLTEQGFIADSHNERMRPAFVFATSAGEVGVDLDADHMVCDLVSWERMVQRLGRVNRRGDTDSRIIVVDAPPSKDEEKARGKAAKDRNTSEHERIAAFERKDAVRTLLVRLPDLDGALDASPGAIREMKLRSHEDSELQALVDAATTPAPLRPALSRALVDAWSMTSLREHTGRPEIDPWLRGWIADQPRTTVVWRVYLPVRTRAVRVDRKEIERFFEAAPPHTSETLETETYRVIDWLFERAGRLILRATDGFSRTMAEYTIQQGDGSTPIRRNDTVAFCLSSANDLRALFSLNDLPLPSDDKDVIKRKRGNLEDKLLGGTLIVDARIGGLSEKGLLDANLDNVPHTADDGDEWMGRAAGHVVGFRMRTIAAEQKLAREPQWRERTRFATELTDDGEPTGWLVIEKWKDDAATENDRAVGRSQSLDEHQSWAENRARELGRRLSLPEEYIEMLAIATSLHDEGKRAPRWQRAFNATRDGVVYAKTLGPINYALLDGYRHEFGSLSYAKADTRFSRLSDDLQDLALHLIAAHHGFARPVIRVNGCDGPPSLLEERAGEVALRFARLQKRWGPWGLAWWEALLRAADQQASRDNDNFGVDLAKEVV